MSAQAIQEPVAEANAEPADATAGPEPASALAEPAPQGSGPEPSLPSSPPVSAAAAATERVPAPAPGNALEAFLAQAPVQCQAARELARRASQSIHEAERQEALAELYLLVCSLTPQAGCAELQPVLQLTLALNGLLKKLIEQPGSLTQSAPSTLAEAVELLDQLCRNGTHAELNGRRTGQLLVVDDDPIVRRALAGALQVVFGRPDSAADGPSALALAAEKTYDVVFLDVQMPGMSGFTACIKIRETVANRHTPIVFVTSHGELPARVQSTACGGNYFITKPFLPQELALKALTLALSQRLQSNTPMRR